MKKLLFPLCLLGGALFAFTALNAEINVKEVTTYFDPKTQLTLVTGDLGETDNTWYIEQPVATAPITQVQLETSASWAATNTADDDGDAVPRKLSYRFHFAGLLRDKNATEATLTLRNDAGKTKSVRVNLANAKRSTDGIEKIFNEWASFRAAQWQGLTPPDAPNLLSDYWESRAEKLYLEKDRYKWRSRSRRNTRDTREDKLGALSVFGGQLAIHETLQTQLIKDGDAIGAVGADAVDVAKIPGVDVTAHPYAEMLAALKPAAALPSLADYVPPDRVLVLLREPKKVAALFNGADDTVSRLAPLLGESFADHALLARYTAKFGLTPDQVRQWFSGGNVAELALFAPDVFFRDSTDFTLIIRAKPDAPTPFKLAKRLPVALSFPLPDGTAFHLASRADLLFLSTHKGELDAALKLADAQGAGSLGRLDEFRVMTAKLPLGLGNGGYVYFSDPFLRRLTGPEVKIGQLRRSVARAQLQTLTVAALAHRLDHGALPPDIATLQSRGYLDAGELNAADISLNADGTAVSKTWGTLANLRTLTQNPALKATSAEAEAYGEYRDTYKRFWRQYFDPIAVRLDLEADGRIALETFILPLIDNSFYASIKSALGGVAASASGLPEYREPPVASLAYKLPSGDSRNWLSRALRDLSFRPADEILPLFENTIVFSVRDAEPVIQTHFPALSRFGQSGKLSGMSGEEMLLVPIVGALLTRPCDLAIKVKDEAAVRDKLRWFASLLPHDHWDPLDIERVFLEKEKRVVGSLSLEGLIRFDFSLSVENGWLHLSNHPWSHVPITGTSPATAPNHVQLTLDASQLKAGLPQALALAGTAWRKSVYASASELLPWMVAYDVGAVEALKLQQVALGRSTPPPRGVEFSATPLLEVKSYGTWYRTSVPSADLADTGLFRDLRGLRLWMRFEDDGLRSRAEFLPQK